MQNKQKQITIELRKLPAVELMICLTQNYPATMGPLVAFDPSSDSSAFYVPYAK